MKSALMVLAIVLSTNAYAESAPFFATLPSSLHEDQTLPLADEIQFEVELQDADALIVNLSDWQGITTEKLGENKVLVRQQPRPRFSGPVVSKHTESSFVVDIEEESVIDFVAGFSARSDTAFSVDQLAAYVSEFIDSPSLEHGFNIASVVARTRSGDCTEFAVLTAALAKSLSLPARVVFGAVIVNVEERVAVYGHAWTEIWHQDKWQIADSALYPLAGSDAFYMPTAALENEGLGYVMSVASATVLLPSGLEAMRNVSP